MADAEGHRTRNRRRRTQRTDADRGREADLTALRGLGIGRRPVAWINDDIEGFIASRAWDWDRLRETQDVTGWIRNPDKIPAKIKPNFERFAGLIDDGAHVLDAGCCGGYAYDFLVRHKPALRYTGIDPHADVARAAAAIHAGCDGAEFRHGDLFDIEGEYDAVLCSRVLIHLPRFADAVAKLVGLAPLVFLVIGVGKDLCQVIREDDGKEFPLRTFSRETVEEAARAAGARAEIFNDGRYQSVVLRRC